MEDRALHDLAVRLSVLEERARGNAKRLKLQAKEYERRLAELNHAHQQQVERDADFVRLDKFDVHDKDMRVWQTEVRNTLSELQGRTAGTRSTRDDARAIWALLIGGLALLASIVVPLLLWRRGVGQ